MRSTLLKVSWTNTSPNEENNFLGTLLREEIILFLQTFQLPAVKLFSDRQLDDVLKHIHPSFPTLH